MVKCKLLNEYVCFLLKNIIVFVSYSLLVMIVFVFFERGDASIKRLSKSSYKTYVSVMYVMFRIGLVSMVIVGVIESMKICRRCVMFVDGDCVDVLILFVIAFAIESAYVVRASAIFSFLKIKICMF